MSLLEVLKSESSKCLGMVFSLVLE